MPSVKVKENEPFDVALRRFKRSCEKAGLLAEVRKREHYEKPTTVRKRAAAAAVKRHLKKMSRENLIQWPPGHLPWQVFHRFYRSASHLCHC